MEIISHRGYWLELTEKNTERAFRRSFELGFGTETDVRDCNGRLVISHDPAGQGSMAFSQFLSIYKDYPVAPKLALNVKSDGLQKMLVDELGAAEIKNYFLFDMTVPDHVQYFSKKLNTFARYSEYEKQSELWDFCTGIWYDGFKSLNIDIELILQLIERGKVVSIVSPELHGREKKAGWSEIYNKLEAVIQSDKLMLCTDHPEEAEVYFNGK